MGFKIISDGTPRGTQVLNNGVLMENVCGLEIDISPSDVVKARITVLVKELDIAVREEHVDIDECPIL